jgi:hypothetical protein
MNDTEPTHDQLDDAVRAHVASDLEPGEIVVSWIVVAATRVMDGGGNVILAPAGGCMPNWEARGVLAEALSIVRSES